MKKEIADQLAAALRSGKYPKTTGNLHDNKGFCCLGVLCDISGLGKWEEPSERPQQDRTYRVTHNDYSSGNLPKSVMEWAGMRDMFGAFFDDFDAGKKGFLTTPRGKKEYYDLAELNDQSKKDFKFMADFIEKHWEKL